MEDHLKESARSTEDLADWSAIANAHQRRKAGSKEFARSNVGNVVMLVGALAAHAALGYFGYLWIKSLSAPALVGKDPIQATPTSPTLKENSVAKKPLAAKEEMAGKLHWSRGGGWDIKPNQPENWKCAGGYYYSTAIAENGSTIIELILVNNRPLQCKA